MIQLSSLLPRFDRLDNPEALCDTLPSGAFIRYLLAGEKDWWIHHGDLVIPGDLDADIMLVVTGNLVVHGIYDDYVSSVGALLVQKSLAARHVHTWGALHIVGDAMVDGLLYANYNDYALHVEGLTYARCFLVSDHDCKIRLADHVPQLDEGFRMDSIRAIFSDAVCERIEVDDDEEDEDDNPWVSLPEWGIIDELLQDGVEIWRKPEA